MALSYRRPVVVVATLLVAGCASVPPPAPAPAPLTSATPAQMVAAVRAAGAATDTELAVRPLRDPATADLRDAAAVQQARGDLAGAAATLDSAIAIAPGDPALLQERAEAALLLGDFAGAEAHARRADALGSQVGPMCRRHWTTVEQARLAAGDAAGAEAARARIAGCRVERPARY
jgi:Flp pilus assembly protein TadD